jgi:hypothetical protein
MVRRQEPFSLTGTNPFNRMPNASKVYVHTYLLEEVWVEGFGLTKVPTL